MIPESNLLRSQRGFSILEVLVTIVILVIGLLGLAGLQARVQQAEFESYQRAHALILLRDMVDRINTNRKAASCFAITTSSSGTPYLGTAYSGPPSCIATGTSADTLAVNSITQWDSDLKGAAVQLGGNAAGAIIGARGCVGMDPAVAPAPDTYTIGVAYQGLTDTAAATVPAGSPAGMAAAVACGQGLYGSETTRRVVWTTLQIARLN